MLRNITEKVFGFGSSKTKKTSNDDSSNKSSVVDKLQSTLDSEDFYKSPKLKELSFR